MLEASAADAPLSVISSPGPSSIAHSSRSSGSQLAARPPARSARASWAALAGQERAAFLFKAADIARRRIYELCGWQILEVGKQWDQAYADVAEAIESATKKDVDRRDIIVPEIHRTGSYKVQVKLHPEVTAEINLEVVSH